MKNEKTSGTSGVAAEMLNTTPDICCKIIANLMNGIVHEGKVPADWSDNIIVTLFKRKGDALDRNNYRGLKLTDHVQKVIERVVENIVCETVNIDKMQFGFCPGRGTTDAIFILRQLQEKYLAKQRKLCMAFVNLKKTFDRVPQKVLGAPGISDQEALSREFRVGCPWEMLYADDLVILAELFEDLMTKVAVWKNSLESKEVKVNMRKTKVMISGRNLHILHTSGKYPCAVCRKGVEKNSIFCSGCLFWVHKKCSDIPGRLLEDPDFRCKRCLGNAWTADGRPCVEVQLSDGKLDAYNNFVYLGNCICQGGGCELLATIERCPFALGKFRELLPLFTCKVISLNTYGQRYNSCVRGTMLYSSEC